MLAIQKGVSRGRFSNESGMGSAPIAAAAAKTDEPCEQVLVSMTGTFMDTIITDVMNGLMAVPNLIGLLGLSGVVVAETNRFLAERKIRGSAGGIGPGNAA